MEPQAITDMLTELRDKAPAELQHYYIGFEDFWERKLWHELTDSVVEYFNHPESAPQRKALFITFVNSFAEKINQLKLVTLGLSAATQCTSNWGTCCVKNRQADGIFR